MFYPCLKCSKQTNSHIILEGMVYLCHTCFLAMPPTELEELREKFRLKKSKEIVDIAALLAMITKKKENGYTPLERFIKEGKNGKT